MNMNQIYQYEIQIRRIYFFNKIYNIFTTVLKVLGHFFLENITFIQ